MKNSFKRLLAVSFIFLSFSQVVKAQDVSLDRIVVTSSRVEEDYADVGRNIDLVTAADIEKSGVQDISAALTKFAPVDISDYGGPGASKTIRMRGSTAAQVLVLVDGRPVNSPRDGQVDLTNIPLENVDRIELMRGPGSSLYGAGAMGGTVNIITKNPPREKQKTEFTSSFGTARTYLERISHGARVSKFGYLFSGEYFDTEGFRDNADFTSRNLNAKFEYELNPQNGLRFSSGFLRSRAGSPGKINSPDIDDKQFCRKNFFDLGWDFKLDDASNLAVKTYQNYDRLEFVENSPDFSKDIHATKVRGLDIQLNKRLTDTYMLVGGVNYVVNLNNSTSSARHKYIVRAGFLENHFDILNNLKINFGSRIDDYSNFGTQICPDFGFLYKLNESFKIHGLAARSFRAPTFNDLYWPRNDYYYEGIWVGGEEGNSNLRPEKGKTGEIGIDARMNKYWSGGITYYRNDYSNLINWADSGGVWKPQNVSSATIDGIELTNKLKLLDNFELESGYTYLRAKDDLIHKYLVYQPKHKIDSALSFVDKKGLKIALSGQLTGMRWYDSENTVKVKRFFTVGLDISKKFNNNLTYFVNIDNLFNRRYEVLKEYPMPGFTVNSGFKLEF